MLWPPTIAQSPLSNARHVSLPYEYGGAPTNFVCHAEFSTLGLGATVRNAGNESYPKPEGFVLAVVSATAVPGRLT